MLGVESESTDEDPDFNDSDYNVYDDDDCLFDRNVTEGIEMGMHIVERVEGQEFDSSSYASSEELNFLSGSDSEGLSGKLNYPEYYVGSEKRNPQFEVGLLFATFEELKSAVRDYAVFNQVEPIFKCNEKNKLHCVCKEGCPWKLWASKIQCREMVQIKMYDPRHTCFKARANKYVTYKWLADYYLDNFKSDPNWKTKNIRATVRMDLEVHITKKVASNARKYAKVLVEGSDEEQFAMLGCYDEELRRTNPGSTVLISQVDNVFRGIYVCIEACKKGFLQGCRRFVDVDGCFLKGKYGGQLLSSWRRCR
ncbi:Hypothetical predicted protein [Olea europaea subsp. europaea]|uniref:Transposase MuDR plant domain-containing protein n=1 Tax=Olea europaea subsp. europaea TaxID=158383 RepID=A0A8S0PC70_OLEEU|nr:Hypothetical predicted protein [Olea europaea subsp. europaea]